MEHVKSNVGKRRTSIKLSGISMSDNLKSLGVFYLFFFIASSFNFLHGQCGSLICNGGTQNNPLEVSVNDFCEVVLIPDVILEAEQTCPGAKRLTVRDKNGKLLGDALDFLSVDVAAYIGQILSVTVTDQNTGVFCVGFIRISDFRPPVFENCPDVVVTCLSDTSAALVGLPLVSDNCDSKLKVTFSDVLVPFGCTNLNNAATITRTWRAVDDSGNSATCEQTITLQRPNLLNVEFPDDVQLDCENPETNPLITGKPILEDSILQNGGLCNLEITFSDDVTPLCGETEFQIVREWTVRDNCTGVEVSDLQIILVLDETGPEIICPGTIYAKTVSGQCYATVNLPRPQISDNCDGAPSLVVTTSYGAVGLGPHSFVPVGIHSVQYIAIDECGSTSMCSAMLIVEDDEEPTAVCNEAAVSISSAGIALVKADVFNEGSTDNCSDELYFKVKRLATASCYNGDDSPAAGVQEWFDDKAAFCCEEVGDEVMITLRVYEIDPGPGPVNPSREAPGGDLFGHFSECSVAVNVQDRIGPSITCPADRAVDCSVDLSDLSIFGSPIVSENCDYKVTESVNYRLDDCGYGFIDRTFTATDDSGNKNSCTQVITIVNGDPYVASDIKWPENYTSYDCGALVDPDNLPLGFNKPVVSTEKCGRLTVHYEDDLYDIAEPACYKILRYWSIVDWCAYDPEFPERGGRFNHVQVIKILDNEAPILECPENLIVGIDGNCESAFVNVPVVTATDCNPDVIITNNSPYAVRGGADASGTYPLGRTTITFTATDGCGNTTTCEVTVNVIDNKPPAPVCIVGLSVNLSMMNGTQMAIVEAKSFNSGSIDNCTDKSDLKFTIRRSITNGPSLEPPTTDRLIFTCEDARKSHLIEFWATDQAGNSDYCETFLLVQDLNDICPPRTSNGMIAGGIQTESGKMVEGVVVKINNGNAFEIFTNLDGHYELGELPHGLDYTIIPQKNDDPLNGVSTLDLVLITQHILGIKKFDSPYKIIAGDVDKSGKITTLDLIRLRKMILNITREFPNGNTSWRFIRADHKFTNPQEPYIGYFPELMNVNDFFGNEMKIDFIGVKVGDVNNSAVPSSFYGGPQTRSFNENWTIAFQNVEVEGGTTFEVPVVAGTWREITGFQFGLSFDPEKVELIEVVPGEIDGISEENFGMKEVDNGLITTSWNSGESVIIEKGSNLFTLKFVSYEPFTLSDILQLSERNLHAEAYDADQMEMGIQIDHLQANAPVLQGNSKRLEVYQNRPNPFSDRTNIPFQLSQSGIVSLRVYDSTGKMIYSSKQTFESGYNQISLDGNKLNGTGLLYYQLETNGEVVTKKMLFNR